MKKIEAIVREDTFHLIKFALEEKGFISMTVTKVSGRGKQSGVTLNWRGSDHRVEFLPKRKIEMVVNDDDCQLIIDIICEKGNTNNPGDGKIFVLPVDEAIRIRTGERGVLAI